MNAAQLTTNTKTIHQVTGRILLLALGYGIGIGASLGVLTGFGLPLVVPALSSIEWLATIIATEVYLWPIIFVFGLESGWVRERKNSLTPFLIMHVLNSITMIAAAYFITGWRV